MKLLVSMTKSKEKDIDNMFSIEEFFDYFEILNLLVVSSDSDIGNLKGQDKVLYQISHINSKI